VSRANRFTSAGRVVPHTEQLDGAEYPPTLWTVMPHPGQRR
jgi:hypothetical protein